MWYSEICREVKLSYSILQGYDLVNEIHYQKYTLGSTSDDKLIASLNEIENSILALLSGVNIPSSYLVVLKQVTRYGTPYYKRIYKLCGAHNDALPQKTTKELLDWLDNLSESSSDDEYNLFRGLVVSRIPITLHNSINNASETGVAIQVIHFFRGKRTLPLHHEKSSTVAFQQLAEGSSHSDDSDEDWSNNRDEGGFNQSQESMKPAEYKPAEYKPVCGIVQEKGTYLLPSKFIKVDIGGENRVSTVGKEKNGSISENKIDTCLTGHQSSVVQAYKTVTSKECGEGKSCLRHGIVLGLVRSPHFSDNSCSNLDVGKICTKNKHGPIVCDSSGDLVKNIACKGRNATDRSADIYQEKKSKIKETNTSSQPLTSETPSVIQKVYPYLTVNLHAGNFQEIINLVDSLLESMDSSNQADISLLFISGLSHFKLKNYACAKGILLKCDEVCILSNKPGDSALCNLYLGDIQFLSHQYHEASSHYKKAISRYSSSDTVAAQFRMVPPSLSSVHAKHGSALRNAAMMVDAIKEYKSAIEKATTDKDGLAANTSLGNLYQSVGENTSALSHYELSVELSERLRDYISLGWARGNMGNAYLGLFQKDKALYHLQKSLELTLEHEPTPQAIGRAYNNLGTAYQSLGDLDKAQEQYEHALSQAIYGNDRAGQARVYGNMGNILMLSKKYEEAVQQYTEVLLLSKDHSTLSTAHHNRGCAYYEWSETEMEKLYGEGVVLTSTATDGSSKEKTDIMEVTFFIHGKDFKNASDWSPHKVPDSITKYYECGYDDLNEVVKFHEDHLNNIKGSSRGLTLSVSLFETNSRTFHRLQDCLVNLESYSRALLVAEQSRSRTLGELMLKRKGQCLQNPLTSPMSFDEIVATAGSIEHPILYLSYTGARLLGWVFVSKIDEVKLNMFEVPLKDDQFDGKSFDYHLRYSLTDTLVERNFEMYREVSDYDEDTSAPVQTLYNLIAKPLLAILAKYGAENADKLVIISDSYTALLPFSSLHDSRTNTFLGDHFSFQIMPSLLTMGILNQLSGANVVTLPEVAQHMCIVGNPNIPQFKHNDEVWNLGKLPHAKQEAEAVANILKTTPILEAQATKSAVLMRIMNAKIIHLATHGSASSGFLAFGMLVPLGQDRAANAQGVLLYPEEVEKLNINPALVVLSSCDSGRGAVKADGIQGMARAFILAGAQAVLTTLWRVPDESAAIFMQFFYQYMMDGLESTKALQKAILSIRCFSKYSQYIHWSGYQLTGRDIYLKYTSPEAADILEKRLGTNSVFPRFQDVKLLVAGLLDVTCYPTNVQVCIVLYILLGELFVLYIYEFIRSFEYVYFCQSSRIEK